MRKRSILAAGILAAAGVLGSSAAAFASPAPTPSATAPNGAGTAAVSGSIAESCGFSNSSLGSIAFGNLTPGVVSAKVPLAYTVTCNDTDGYGIYVSDQNNGPKIMQNGVPVTPGASIYDVTSLLDTSATTPWTSGTLSGNGAGLYSLIDEGASATAAAGQPYTDNWSITLPTSIFYPGSLTDTITYGVFAQ